MFCFSNFAIFIALNVQSALPILILFIHAPVLPGYFFCSTEIKDYVFHTLQKYAENSLTSSPFHLLYCLYAGKAVFLARDKHHLADLSHLIRHEAPYLFQKYVQESHGKDVRVIVVGGRVVGTMLRCSTDGRMQSNCSLGKN